MIRLCDPADVADGTARRFDVAGQRVALVRIGEAFYAIGDRCSHADVSLSDGDVLTGSLELECWKHGSAFSLETGEPSCLPALRPVPVYEVEVRDGGVYVGGGGLDDVPAEVAPAADAPQDDGPQDGGA